jgi:hypothetical protein
VDAAFGAFLLCLGVAALSLSVIDARGRSSRLPGVRQHLRSWTSPLSAIQARIALLTVGQRLGYSVDGDERPGFTVLADRVLPGSYGQLYPVSLTSAGGGTLVRVSISAKDPALALTEVVQERRLEEFARSVRAIFVAAEEEATAS